MMPLRCQAVIDANALKRVLLAYVLRPLQVPDPPTKLSPQTFVRGTFLSARSFVATVILVCTHCKFGSGNPPA
jgi:hypothetical protein